MALNLLDTLAGAGRWRRPLAVAALAVLAAGVPAGARAQTSMDKARALRRATPFNLAASPTKVLQANLVQCGLINDGNVCTDVFNSPTGGGGFWPAGTTNQYIFNSGLQIAGIIPRNAGFAWAGDTVGAYFFDARGTQFHGDPRTPIYDSLDPNDLANWPEEAYVRDTAIFNAQLIGQKAISDQDTWVKYWDGDPNKLSNRKHPMGIEVTQRSLAFNAPAGAEHTIFFIYTFKNITNDPDFIAQNEAKFPGLNLPDGGYTIDSIFAAFAMDPDVTTHATDNFSTAILPFNLGVAYKANFQTDDFNFAARADLYAPPFFQGPGFVGVKYLKSPVDPQTRREVGLSLFSNTLNAATGFPDPVGDRQLYRYLSGTASPAAGDNPCNIPNPKVSKLCFLWQDPADTRFYQSSGPFSLRPGESATIVVAYTHGAPVAVPGYTPGTTLRPGIPSRTPGVGSDTLRTIERIAGWVATPPDAVRPDGSIDETKVRVVRRSLLSNALVAQSIFNNKFLLPRPPEPPAFALVPGNNQVTIVWQPSATERTGDPYYAIASNPDPNNQLYDPNYRQKDVEGYRIYRATGLSGGFELVAQFDYKGTVMVDRTGQLDPNFVPEEGQPYTPVEHELRGRIVMYPDGARIRDAVTGSVVVLREEAIELEDTGVPFAFIDRGVKNGVTYRYIVTAFDVNSLKSGALSLESPRQVQQVIPRADPTNLVLPKFTSSVTNAQGQPLPSLPHPTIDPQTGIFSGPMPPADGLSFTFAPLVERLMPKFSLTATIDSILPYTVDTHPRGCPNGSNALGACWQMYMTVDVDGNKSTSVAEGWTPIWDAFGDPLHSELPMGGAAVPPDATTASKFRLPSGFPGFQANVVGTFAETILYSQMEGQTNRRGIAGATIYPGFATGERMVPGGSRWFSGPNESVPDPTALIKVGHLDGVDSVWAPIHHTPTRENDLSSIYPASGQMQCFSYFFSQMGRAADVKFTWGANGQVTVTDVSHNTPVIFKPTVQASYGFLNRDANGNGVIDWADFNYIANVSPAVTDGNSAGLACGHQHDPSKVVQLEPTARLNPVSLEGTSTTTPKTAQGLGFGLYVNGERYIFVLRSLPSAGTVWTLRTYTGLLRAPTRALTYDPAGYTFWANLPPLEPRQPMVTGLTFRAQSTSGPELVGKADLSKVHTVPDPYYVRSAYEVGPANKRLYFVNLPPQAIVRIYTLNGTLVRVLEHNDPQDGTQLAWDLRNRNNQFVASGVYFYVVETPDGDKKVGRFTVIQFAR